MSDERLAQAASILTEAAASTHPFKAALAARKLAELKAAALLESRRAAS